MWAEPLVYTRRGAEVSWAFPRVSQDLRVQDRTGDGEKGEGSRSDSPAGTTFWSRAQNSRNPEFETRDSDILGRWL